MKLHKLISVWTEGEEDAFVAEVDLTDRHGHRYVCNYVTRPNDPYGLAPVVRKAVLSWVAKGKPVGKLD